MENKDLKKNINIKLILAIFALVCFVGGVPMIVIFAKLQPLLMVLGILMVIFGFYGSPILFIVYGSDRQLMRIYNAITIEKLTTNKEISTQLAMTEEQVKSCIQTLVTKQYLKGYLYDGVSLKNNEKIIMGNTKVSKCPNCGKDNRSFVARHKILSAIAMLVILGGIGGAMSEGGAVEEVNEIVEKEVKVDKYQVEITSGYNDGYALYIEGTVTNNSGRDLSYVQILIPTYDADGNKVGDAMDNINNLKDGETWKFKAMDLSGGVNYDAENYELDAF